MFNDKRKKPLSSVLTIHVPQLVLSWEVKKVATHYPHYLRARLFTSRLSRFGGGYHHCGWAILVWHQHRIFLKTQEQISANYGQKGSPRTPHIQHHRGYKTPEIRTVQPHRCPGKTEKGKFFWDLLYLFPTNVIWYVKQTEWITKINRKQRRHFRAACFTTAFSTWLTALWRRRTTPSTADARGRTVLSAQPGSNKNATDMFGNVCWDNNSGINRYINGVFVCVCEADASLGKRCSMNVSEV